jgi:hypothetical protein
MLKSMQPTLIASTYDFYLRNLTGKSLKVFQKVANQNVRTLQKLCKMSLNALYNFCVFVLSVKRQCKKMCNQEKGKEHSKIITNQLTRL